MHITPGYHRTPQHHVLNVKVREFCLTKPSEMVDNMDHLSFISAGFMAT